MHLPTILNKSCYQSIQMSWMNGILDNYTLIHISSNLTVHYYMWKSAVGRKDFCLLI